MADAVCKTRLQHGLGLTPSQVEQLLRRYNDRVGDLLDVLERVKDERDLAAAGVLAVEPITAKLPRLVRRALAAQRWIPCFRAFMRYHEWAQTNALDFSHLSRVSQLEWAVFEFNPFCIVEHLLQLARERRERRRVPWLSTRDGDYDLRVFKACVERCGPDWNDLPCARYAAVFLVLATSPTTYVSRAQLKRRLYDDYRVAWSEDFLSFDPSCGMLRQHPVYDASDGGTRNLNCRDAHREWPVPDRKMTVYDVRSFARLQNQIEREEILDPSTRERVTSYALRDRALYLRLIVTCLP